jgi:endonuclease/exonuclease/phosphatase family metal-dependent hydrolase
MVHSFLIGFWLERRRHARLLIGALLLLLLGACSAPPAPATRTPGSEATATLPAENAGSAFLARAPDAVRVLSFNPYWDSIFPDTIPEDQFVPRYDKAAAFRRIAAATAPDLFCLQEIAPARDPRQVAGILDEVLPLASSGWQVQQGQDTVIASRYPLSLRDTVLVYRGVGYSLGHAMALVDLPDERYDHDLYVICAHFMSQGGEENIAARQAHADRIIAWLADARSPGGEVDLPPGTPFLVLGDLNVYDTDPAHHLTTLLTGDVSDEERFGPDAPPDWDGTDLGDVLPRHNGSGDETYTWRDDTQQFNPGVLDRILYSDSALTLVSSFVLNTATLDAATLAAAGLEAADVALDLAAGNYDHLPLVADFR